MAARKNQGSGRGRGRPRKSEAAAATPTPDNPTQTLANVKARADFFAQACEDIYQLDQKIADIVDAEIRDLREGKQDIMRILREEYHIPAVIFRARYYAYKIERKANDAKDNATLDVIKELFDSLPIGEIIEIMDEGAEEPPPRPAAPPPMPEPAPERLISAADEERREGDGAEIHDYDAAKEAGYRAGFAGQSLTVCPYKGPTQKGLKAQFEDGWQQGQFDLQEQQKNGPQENDAVH